jgi:hypothetical protein
MKISSLLSFLSLWSAVSAIPSLEEVSRWDVGQYLEEKGFYSGDLDDNLRSLKAATKRADLTRRADDGIAVLHRLDLSYAESEWLLGHGHLNSADIAEDENEYGAFGAKSVFRTRLEGETRHPVLLLEKHDQHIGVECGGETVSLIFNNKKSFEAAKKTTQEAIGGTVITSHPGCNEDHERRPFKIEGVSAADDKKRIDLKVSKRQLKDVYKKMSVEYGYSDESYVLRKNQFTADKEKRRYSYSPTWTAPAFTSYPATPTGTAVADHGEVDLSWESTSEFTLPSVVTDHLRFALNVGCNECKQTGKAIFTQGKFDIDFDFDWSDLSFSVIQNGWVQLDIKDYSLHMDMFAIPQGQVYFSYPIVEIPFPGAGFKIPGVGKVGVFFTPQLSATFTIKAPIQFNYGFDVTMPDSSLRLDFADIDDGSHMTGFQDAEITPLPFSANTTDPSFQVDLSFMPRIPMGLTFGTDEDGKNGFKAEAGLFTNLPKLTWVFESGCGGDNSTSSALAVRSPGDLATRDDDEIFINVAPRIGIDGGFDLQLKARIDGINPGIWTRPTLASTSWALPTTCFSVDLGASTWSQMDAPTARDLQGKKPARTPLVTPKPTAVPSPDGRTAIPVTW